ncbi:hypothetical protein [Microbacterium atlanticum]|uniref:hypothetical protein n=1 Tax=Microbacterium atlanticum TaxID=2782168 RepID=UPI0018887AC8|nr:hypothetical protein [Microbacterium atlanticum]
MHAIELIIGEYVHRLPRGADEEAVLAQLTDAVHAGGAVVSLPALRPHTSVSVLISPGVPVVIERTLIEEEASAGECEPFDVDLMEWAGP